MKKNQTGSAVSVPQARNPRGKYITLAILLAWVFGVIVFTFFKFSGGIR